jgi:hypothetical protein
MKLLRMLLSLLNSKYNYHGKDARGVPICTGSADKPPLFICLVSLVGPIFWLIALLNIKDLPWVLRPVFVVISSLLLISAKRYWEIRRSFAHLSTLDVICKQYNVAGETFQGIVEEQQIKPRYNINGRDFYDLNDLGDAATLLRASAPPVAPETLLRAAAHVETPQEQLLRASDTYGEPS